MNKYFRFLIEKNYYIGNTNKTFCIPSGYVAKVVSTNYSEFYKNSIYGIDLEGHEYYINTEQCEEVGEQAKIVWEVLFGDIKMLQALRSTTED